MSYLHKKVTEAYASQTDLLNLQVFYGELTDFKYKRHIPSTEHNLTSSY